MTPQRLKGSVPPSSGARPAAETAPAGPVRTRRPPAGLEPGPGDRGQGWRHALGQRKPRGLPANREIPHFTLMPSRTSKQHVRLAGVAGSDTAPCPSSRNESHRSDGDTGRRH